MIYVFFVVISLLFFHCTVSATPIQGPLTKEEATLLRIQEGPKTDDERREYAEALLYSLYLTEKEPDRFWVPTGFAALGVCSAIFVSGIDEQTAIEEDGDIASLAVDYDIDYVNRTVTCSMKIAPEQKYTAVFWGPTLGCTLAGGGYTVEDIRNMDVGLQTPIPPRNGSAPWPLGDGDPAPWPPVVDRQCVEDVVNEDFDTPIYNVRSTVIIYDQQLIYERYSSTVNKRSPLLSWSMAKSLTSTLYGIVQQQGLFELSDPADVPQWANDTRRTITYEDMLYMASGILWQDGLSLFACLYWAVDCATFYANYPLIAEPGTRFRYSTANSYLLAEILERRVRGDREINTFDWHREKLFRRMGMDNAVFEFVPHGYLAGGSLAYLTARDWARYGLLYQRRGDWFGDQIVTPEWVDYSCTRSPSEQWYGAHWWTIEIQVDPRACVAEGFRRQNVFVFPTRNVVIVRNAMPAMLNSFLWDRFEYINRIMSCFP